MDARTRKALEDSIAHWERMTDDPKCGDKPGSSECSLCTLFNTNGGACRGCPVFERTGVRKCDDTPYGDAWDTFYEVISFDLPYTPERRAAMQAEVDFLKSLRPKDGE